jgi:DNA repair photolyase
LIWVKLNAVELLRHELSRLPVEVIGCGDWQQPAERVYRLSRRMLEVVLEQRFPLFLVERSPLLSRDLDLLVEIDRRSWVGVVFSISSLDPVLKRAFEPRSPGVRQRFRAMEQLATAGLKAGTALMPVIPVLGDTDEQLEEVVRRTRDHGGAFVMAGPLTMEGDQARRTLAAALSLRSDVEGSWRELYRWPPGERPQYGPTRQYCSWLGLKVRELCARFGLLDRMPRYVAPGPLAVNKRIAEALFLKTYDLELEQANEHRIWAYRKAAWTVDEWEGSVADIYAEGGEAGLRKLPAVGRHLSAVIAQLLQRDRCGQGG